MRKVLLATSTLLLLSGCRSLGTITIDLKQYCREHPEECGKPALTPTPQPTSSPEPTSTPALPTPTPEIVATPTPPVSGTSCAPVEAIDHWLVGAGGPHAWHPIANNRVHVVVDTTVRPICDTDHMDNWNTFCGKQSHDPAGYNTAAGAQSWKFSGSGIIDLGPNGCDTDHPHEASPDCNSAQRVFSGPAGGEVHIDVCLRPDQVTDLGCPIPLRADPCSHQTWTLPR